MRTRNNFPQFFVKRFVLLFIAVLFTFLATSNLSSTNTDVQAQNPDPRTVFVHLFEWKWTDIAQECENFLGPKGFSAVQVSPPNEHAVVNQSGNYPWWERYQPVSYQIESRSGSRAEFIDMINRCNAVGVDIYVDAVINHMTGVSSGIGIAGSPYQEYNYPGLYNTWDFHHCGRNGNDDIQNYGDAWEVQNCELVNLADLDTGSSYVRGRIAAYLNDLVSIGVAGFRLDASKHMHTNDINAILSQVNGNPYVFQEVIDQGGEPITADQYFNNGDVTEFKYSVNISNVFYSGQLSWLSNFGEAWGFMPSDKAVVFVDNHDNQRGHGGGGHIITHQDGSLYDLTNVFMLAWPYGYPKVMSSYAFSSGDQGPPSDGYGNTNTIYNNGSPNCFGAWKCEHRWQAIANMVGFRNATASALSVNNWWSNGNNQIAFSRGDKGFVAINKEGYSLSGTFQTGLPAGTYCNIIDGDYNNGTCSGSTVTVDNSGFASINVAAGTALAIHVNATTSGGGGGGGGGGGSIATTFNVGNAYTQWGQNVYVVGNISQLGSWNPCSATKLTASNYPTWSGTLNLPASTSVEYKYIKYYDGNCNNVEWESGANHSFTTPSSGSTTRNDTW